MSKHYKSYYVLGLLLVVCIVGTGVSGPFFYQGVSEFDEKEIINTVNSYFSWRYEGLKSKASYADMPTLVDSQNIKTKEWFDKERDKRDVEIFIHNKFNVKILDYRFYLDFRTIKIDENQAYVEVAESNEITYEDNPKQPSATANIEHQISLIREKDGWVITNDEYTDDLKDLLKILDKSQVIKNIIDNHDRIYHDASPRNLDTPAAQDSTIASGLQLFGYNNTVASTYADNYWNVTGPVPPTIQNVGGWNSNWPTSYQDYGDLDCTNFASQAVFEGIAYTASDQNYFYPDSTHYNNWWYYKFSTPIDGSQPWTNVGGFYQFLTLNAFNYEYYPEYTIRGPMGHGINLCYIRLGDVIFMYADGNWHHTVIVDQVGSYTCGGNTVYVAAHSVDSRRRPLYDYSGYTWYSVRIDGFLDEANTAYIPTVIKGTESLAKGAIGNPYPAIEDLSQKMNTPLNPYPSP